jgi:hypothetical protein
MTGEAVRTLATMIAAVLAIGAADAPPGPPTPKAAAIRPSDWLQERLDRILARTGKAPGEVKAVIADTTDLPWTHPAGMVQFPRALLVMAPSPEAIDGMLAMLLSYRQEEPGGRQGGGLASIRASGTFGAAGDTLSDQDGSRSGRGGQAGAAMPVTEDPAEVRRARAWQGARWNGQIGNCAAVQVDFLRATGREARIILDGKPAVWPGSPFSRKVIEYLGAQAYPAEQRCRTREDPAFAVIQTVLQSAAAGAEPAG